MPRQLPEDPVKRRRQLFKRIYQHLDHFQAQVEAGNFPLPLIITLPGTAEEVYVADLMVGIDSLPPRQREAFGRICRFGWTETDATRIMLPDSQWSTPVQQYADAALDRMIKAYDNYQVNREKPAAYVDKRRKATPAAAVEVA